MRSSVSVAFFYQCCLFSGIFLHLPTVSSASTQLGVDHSGMKEEPLLWAFTACVHTPRMKTDIFTKTLCLLCSQSQIQSLSDPAECKSMGECATSVYRIEYTYEFTLILKGPVTWFWQCVHFVIPSIKVNVGTSVSHRKTEHLIKKLLQQKSHLWPQNGTVNTRVPPLLAFPDEST